jgi:hypothetical protein
MPAPMDSSRLGTYVTGSKAPASRSGRTSSPCRAGGDWWTQIEEAIRAPSVEHLVLIVTPSVLERSVVRREIRLARQEGVQVTPVAEVVDNEPPRWIGHVHDLRYTEQWERLVSVLKGPSTHTRMPFMAPDLPDGFVPRVAEFEALKARLLDARGDAVGITAALRGAGGYGKTVLANALCHDEEIQDAYCDGILRVVLGERADNLLGLVSDLIKMITGEPGGSTQLTLPPHGSARHWETGVFCLLSTTPGASRI